VHERLGSGGVGRRDDEIERRRILGGDKMAMRQLQRRVTFATTGSRRSPRKYTAVDRTPERREDRVQRRALALAVSERFSAEMVGARFHGLPDLAVEAQIR
jgi:hypothetical protein